LKKKLSKSLFYIFIAILCAKIFCVTWALRKYLAISLADLICKDQGVLATVLAVPLTPALGTPVWETLCSKHIYLYSQISNQINTPL